MKIHLTGRDSIEVLAHKKRKYEEVYIVRKPKKLFDLTKYAKELEYIDHMVTYGTIKLELCSVGLIFVRLNADRVVLEWTEK